MAGTWMFSCKFVQLLKQLYWNHTSAWVFSCNFAAYFQNTFSSEQLWVAASENSPIWKRGTLKQENYSLVTSVESCSESHCVLQNSWILWQRLLFNSMIRSQFSYCPLIWMNCLRKSKNQINKVYERSYGIVANDKHVILRRCDRAVMKLKFIKRT